MDRQELEEFDRTRYLENEKRNSRRRHCARELGRFVN